MPPRKTGTTEPEAPAAEAVIVDEPDAVSDAEMPEDLQAKIVDLLTTQNETIQALESRLSATEAELNQVRTEPGDVPSDAGPQLRELPAGTKRYRHLQYLEATLVFEPGENLLVDGRRIYRRSVQADFHGGVFETDNDRLIEGIEDSQDWKVGQIIEDPLAIAQHSTVQVQGGVRTTDSTPRASAELAAPMR